MRGDCEMMDVSGEDRFANAPQFPRHPMYKGETLKDKREFVKRYQDYYTTLLAYETCQNKPFVMPVSACVEVWTTEQILKFEMEKSAMEVTEQVWINYFREAGEPDYVDLAKIDAEMRKLKMDFTLTDASSRISRLRNQIYRVLDQHGLQDYVEQADPKRIVQWIVDALEPPTFKRRILEKLGMDVHKTKKKNPVVFLQMGPRFIEELYGVGASINISQIGLSDDIRWPRESVCGFETSSDKRLEDSVEDSHRREDAIMGKTKCAFSLCGVHYKWGGAAGMAKFGSHGK
ncbi:hypothetical protein ABG067_001211 [Albugo candida]